MNRVFIDMDGVIVDFARYMRDRGLTGEEVKSSRGAYLSMEAIPGALDAVRSIIGMGFEVWIATKPPTGFAFAYADKAAWILRELPELKRRIIITHDKGLLGDAGDVLVDDRLHKANCSAFPGLAILFDASGHVGSNWPAVLNYLRSLKIVRGHMPGFPPIGYTGGSRELVQHHQMLQPHIHPQTSGPTEAP